ncbi:Hsp70 family protein [Cellvibrio sp. OA-2007]|uniref:Hsp70 family protein n=1 Tax=Cellvibrio sp. OA-2007 TaxID=529823 RepID=UPI0007843096|nr:molecular chaperone HscC [Cellvibrio sp. OA-2007]
MTVIGIDLGTTNSACGYWTEDGPKLIPNRLGELLTPSVVGLDEAGAVIVGKAAKERLIDHSGSTVAAFKRLMGSDHKIMLNKKLFSAPELSALVLRSLKEDAEAFLGEPVTEAVISVPAYFDDNQRHATKLAGELAGLKVDRLINEPTAAAIAYGLHQKQEGTFLILDMGGGTFDVSILEFFDGVMEVHASAGDNFLGGEDFVEAMVDALLNELQIEKSSLDVRLLQTLYMQMESAKRRVSQMDTQEILLDFGGEKIRWSLTRDWFSRVATPLILRSKRPIERAMSDANLSPAQIDDIVLVGGSTRLALFRSTVGRIFGRLPSTHIDPDTVVALGAAVQAALLSKNSALDDMVLTDVCPYTLGTGVVNEDSPQQGLYFLPIIERNSTVPVSVVRRLATAADNQTELQLEIYQGENRLVKKNIFLGQLNIKIPKAPRGKEEIDVRYTYDMNGLLEVDVTVVSQNKTYSKLIQRNPGVMSEKEKEASLKKMAALKFHPRESEVNRALIAKGERLYEASLGDKREKIAAILSQFDAILDRQNVNEIKKAQLQVKELLESLDSEDWL